MTVVSFQRMCYFEPNPIIGKIKTAATFFVSRVEPLRPNQNEHDLTFGETLLKYCREFGSGTHIDVNEYAFASRIHAPGIDRCRERSRLCPDADSL